MWPVEVEVPAVWWEKTAAQLSFPPQESKDAAGDLGMAMPTALAAMEEIIFLLFCV